MVIIFSSISKNSSKLGKDKIFGGQKMFKIENLENDKIDGNIFWSKKLLFYNFVFRSRFFFRLKKFSLSKKYFFAQKNPISKKYFVDQNMFRSKIFDLIFFSFIQFTMKISMKNFEIFRSQNFRRPISKYSNFFLDKPFWSRFFSKVCGFSWRRRWNRVPGCSRCQT